jgi:hypothetical protein
MATPRLTAFLGSGPPARLRLASAHCRLNEPVFVEEEGLPEPSKEAVSKSVVAPTGDRQFESPSLQRGSPVRTWFSGTNSIDDRRGQPLHLHTDDFDFLLWAPVRGEKVRSATPCEASSPAP